MSDLLGPTRERRRTGPACGHCGSTDSSKATTGDYFICLGCGELIEPFERTDDPRQMDMLA